MRFEGNDRFDGLLPRHELGRWEFTVQAWVDRLESFRDELRRKVEGGQTDLDSELQEGAALMKVLELDVRRRSPRPRPTAARRRELVRTLAVDCDREVARFGAWYELFPRSWGGFAGVEKVLPELKKLGFDVVYLPPIHPIGGTNRKGPNNALDGRARRTRAAPGRSGARTAGTRRSTRSSGRSRTSTASSPRRGSSASRSRSTSRSSAPPTTRG